MRDSARLTLGDRCVDAATAANYLVEKYPSFTLEHYDCGGPSPRDRLTMTDLGRATVFGAFRGWKSAVELYKAASAAVWPKAEVTWRLDGDTDLPNAEWLAHRHVEAAWNLFSSLAGRKGRGREAATSKVLHMKWPEFFPIIDRELRKVYGATALALEHEVPGSRRRSHPSTRAYWLAIRHDLTNPENREALSHIRTIVEGRRDDDPAKIERLMQLTDLRILDATAWALGSKRIRAS